METTKCHAMGCTIAVSSDFLMCRRHWRMVPKELQDEIWAAFHARDRAEHLILVAKAKEIVCGREVEIGRRCRSCNAPIFFAVNASSQRMMPIDAIPVAEGNVLVRQGKRSTQLYAKVLEKGDEAGEEERYTSHFATCPEAAAWRRPSQKRSA